MEPLTDLATVFFGLGIFSANALLRDRSSHVGNWETWSTSRQGYLAAPVWGYALALFARLRDEAKPDGIHFLRPNVRSPCRGGLAYLDKSDDTTSLLDRIRDGRLATSSLHQARTRSMVEPLRGMSESSDVPMDSDSDSQEGRPFDTAAADEWFTEGTVHMQHGRWAEAVAAFSVCIEHNPRDGESLQQRIRGEVSTLERSTRHWRTQSVR